jgi:alginate O-acetyltransferase complex protein AlgJ
MLRLPHRKILPLAAFGTLMLAAVPVNVAFLRMEDGTLSGVDVSAQRLLSGKVTGDLTARYNDASPFKDFGIDLFGSISFLVFKEARIGTQIGREGVLFSDEEFESDTGSRARIAAVIADVRAVHSILASRGITLIVAPVPLKIDVEAEFLPGGFGVPGEVATRHAAVMAALAQAGVPAADIRASLMAGREQAPVFLRTDTHWTPHGAGVAAQAIAEAATALGHSRTARFEIVEGAPQTHEGDLKKFVRLLPALAHLGPRNDEVVPVTARAAAEASGDTSGGESLFGDAAIPVVLVGTSYSADATFGFEAQLKAALGSDVLNLAEAGKGPLAPMQAFLSGDVLKQSPPELVIWEMPVRFLDDADLAGQLRVAR